MPVNILTVLRLIRLWIEAEAVQIIIEDKGEGIPPAELPYIFEPFYRSNNHKDKDGFGLGLSLASRIIKLHKGQIKVVSALNDGSTFSIFLPTIKSSTSH